MKEINVLNLFDYINPFEIEKKPAIALASSNNKTNGLTIGWASYGILWNKLTVTAYVHAKRYSKVIFDDASYYAICYMQDENKDVVKYFGIVSGRDEDKIKGSNLEVEYNDLAPYFKNSEVVVIARVMGKSDFDVNNVDQSVLTWYQRDGVHSQYYGEIVKVLVNE